jgi:hypothetical protein
MSKGYTGVHAAVKFKRGIRPKHNVANGILGELQHNNILLRLAMLINIIYSDVRLGYLSIVLI